MNSTKCFSVLDTSRSDESTKETVSGGGSSVKKSESDEMESLTVVLANGSGCPIGRGPALFPIGWTRDRVEVAS